MANNARYPATTGGRLNGNNDIRYNFISNPNYLVRNQFVCLEKEMLTEIEGKTFKLWAHIDQ